MVTRISGSSNGLMVWPRFLWIPQIPRWFYESSSTHRCMTDGTGEMVPLLMENNGNNTFSTWDEMQQNHVFIWILLLFLPYNWWTSGEPVKIGNIQWIIRELLFNVLNISIRVGFCPSTVSLVPVNNPGVVKHANQELQPNWAYFLSCNIKTPVGSCDFFWRSLLPPWTPWTLEDLDYTMKRPPLWKFPVPKGRLKIKSVTQTVTNSRRSCGRSLWWWYLDFQRWAHTSPFSSQVGISIFVSSLQQSFLRGRFGL